MRTEGKTGEEMSWGADLGGGGGLAGLALARALGRAGFAPELIEREAGWGDAGTGIPANGVRALGRSG